MPVETVPVVPPTEAEALDASDEPLVPVEVLAAPVAAAEDSAPLIDISPENVDAPPLAEVAQVDDGEVIIPVDPDDIGGDDDEPAGGNTDPVQTPTEQPTGGGGGGLALTGLPLGALTGAALLLLVLGLALRAASGTRVQPGRA